MTWESRMAKRAKTASIKRRLRQNVEGSGEDAPAGVSAVSVLPCSGFEPVTVEHWLIYPAEDEWPDVISDARL